MKCSTVLKLFKVLIKHMKSQHIFFQYMRGLLSLPDDRVDRFFSGKKRPGKKQVFSTFGKKPEKTYFIFCRNWHIYPKYQFNK